jgi:hypothetical protein
MRVKVRMVARTGVLPSLARGEGFGCRDFFSRDVSWEGWSGSRSVPTAVAGAAQLRASNITCFFSTNVFNRPSSLNSRMVGRVATLVDPYRLSGHGQARKFWVERLRK